MPYVIRKIKTSELQELVKLMQTADYRPDYWSVRIIKKYLIKKGHHILIALNKNKIIGYVGLKDVENEDERIRKILGDLVDKIGCLEWIAVHPDYRNRGVASTLLKASETMIKKRKIKGLWLDCRKKVTQLYEKNNYLLKGNYSQDKNLKYVFVKIFWPDSTVNKEV